jgi:hypothetical protein
MKIFILSAVIIPLAFSANLLAQSKAIKHEKLDLQNEVIKYKSTKQDTLIYPLVMKLENTLNKAQQLESVNHDLNIELTLKRNMALNYIIVNLETAVDVQLMIAKIKHHPLVKSVALSTRVIRTPLPNKEHKAIKVKVSTVKSASKTSITDPLFKEQWYFEGQDINSSAANFSMFRSSIVNNLGRKVRVGILDSGSYFHEDLNITPGIEGGYSFLTEHADYTGSYKLV